MYVNSVGNPLFPIADREPVDTSEVQGRERPEAGAAVQQPSPSAVRSSAVDNSLLSNDTPDGADPALWELLEPGERAFLSNGMDRVTYGYAGQMGQSATGRGVYVDLRV